jgi:hypothetical protein
MKSVILENIGLKNPIIFFGDNSWQRIAEKDPSQKVAGWREMVRGGKPVPYKRLDALLQHIVDHPAEVRTFGDSLALSPEDTAATKWVDDQVAKLDAVIIRGIAQRADAKIQIGRALNEQKRLLGHGKFKSHVSEVLGPMISLRTAERYMKAARTEDDESKDDRLSLLKSASDDGAKDVKATTEQARAEIDSQVNQQGPRKRIDLYKLPLPLNDDDRKAVDVLRRSSAWPEAEETLILELRRLCTKHRMAIRENQGEEHEENSSDA